MTGSRVFLMRIVKGYGFFSVDRNIKNYIKFIAKIYYTFFYRQLDFSFEPRVANEILENEPKSCLTVA